MKIKHCLKNKVGVNYMRCYKTFMEKNTRTFEKYLQTFYIKDGDKYYSKYTKEYRTLPEIWLRWDWSNKIINDL